MLGIALDSYNPTHSNKKITENLARRSPKLPAFISQVERLSGRFVLIYKNDTKFIAIGDACHFRQIYYGYFDDTIVLTSSPKLFLEYFDFELKSNPLKTEFVNSTEFIKSEHSWFGNKSPDDRLNKLLPNHYLDITTGSAKRFKPQNLFKQINDDQVIRKASKILKGTYKALLNRNYKLVQPLTAGWDTRALLAASKNWKDQISYYVFNRKKYNQKKNQDVRISSKLAEKLEINFQVISPNELNQNFINRFKENHIYPRILPKTRNIQHHLSTQKRELTININGNSAEILRCYYGNHRGNITLDIIIQFSGFPNNEFVRKELASWYKSANNYAKETGIDLLDLFYWEQRMGNWGALFPYEMDIAIEEISPFNNRTLLYMIYFSGYKNRKKPDHKIFERLIRSMWPETFNMPINPDDPIIKSLLKRNVYTRYYALVVNNIYRKLIKKR